MGGIPDCFVEGIMLNVQFCGSHGAKRKIYSKSTACLLTYHDLSVVLNMRHVPILPDGLSPRLALGLEGFEPFSGTGWSVPQNGQVFAPVLKLLLQELQVR